MLKFFNISLISLGISLGSFAHAGPSTAKMQFKKRSPSSVNCKALNMKACQASASCEFSPGTVANGRPDVCLEKEQNTCESLNMDACNAAPACEFYPGTVANDRPDVCIPRGN